MITVPLAVSPYISHSDASYLERKVVSKTMLLEINEITIVSLIINYIDINYYKYKFKNTKRNYQGSVLECVFVSGLFC